MSLPGYFIKPLFLFCTDEYNSQHQQFLQATHPYANEPKSSVDAAGYFSKHLTLQGKTPQSIKKTYFKCQLGEKQVRKKNTLNILSLQIRCLNHSHIQYHALSSQNSIEQRGVTFLLLSDLVNEVRKSKLQQNRLTGKSDELQI